MSQNWTKTSSRRSPHSMDSKVISTIFFYIMCKKYKFVLKKLCMGCFCPLIQDTKNVGFTRNLGCTHRMYMVNSCSKLFDFLICFFRRSQVNILHSSLGMYIDTICNFVHTLQLNPTMHSHTQLLVHTVYSRKEASMTHPYVSAEQP
jgi:hypothetical protein